MSVLKNCAVLLVVAALSCLAASDAGAEVITLNLDSVVTNNGPGVDATALLNSYGITLTNVSVPGSVEILNMTANGGGWTTSNVLQQNVGGSPPQWYTMNFSTPLQSISFTRPSVGYNAATPIWSATAYVGTEAVGSVGDPNLDAFSWGAPPETYTLSGDGITSLAIYANGENWSGIASVPLNDFVLTTPVPEPSTLVLLGVGAISLLAYIWRRRK